MQKPKRDHRFFEEWAKRNGMRAELRIKDYTVGGRPVADILLADSGELLSRKAYPNEEHDLPRFYRTGYAIIRPGEMNGGAWLAGFCDYPEDAFREYQGEGRKQQRLADALKAAGLMLQQTSDVGLYRGNDRIIRAPVH